MFLVGRSRRCCSGFRYCVIRKFSANSRTALMNRQTGRCPPRQMLVKPRRIGLLSFGATAARPWQGFRWHFIPYFGSRRWRTKRRHTLRNTIATWEKQPDSGSLTTSDLIAGTSTGGITHLGLGLGLSGQQMLDFYQKRGPCYFPCDTNSWPILAYDQAHSSVRNTPREVLLRELETAFYVSGKNLFS